ncbi:MAG: hypothetical protein PSN35_07050 [Candidatus Thioglobus sp.]|uniref:hypothetical protein n=1 Tax=Candidatus Thioglobus sp. TaxID=2026721 RepID=UPI002609F86A|nr:hypothetical protein [Candidatus Thioglobus sp.]MDC9727575.1 hypothetical protein [Candidatus Thioglobus sp.]
MEVGEGKPRTQSLSPENSVDQDHDPDGPIEEESDSDLSEYESDEDGEKTDKIVQYQKEKVR